MVSYLSSFVQAVPILYYGLNTASQFVLPSLVKSKNGPAVTAKSLFPDFFEKVSKLRDDILIYKSIDFPAPAAALGMNCCSAAALVLYHEEFFLLDSDAANWAFKHEFSHIKDSDVFKMGVAATIASAVTTYVTGAIFPWWAVPYASVLVASKVYSICSIVCERKADLFACEHATTDELFGGERLLEALLDANKLLHIHYPKLFSKEGNSINRINQQYIPETKRLEIVQKEIDNRKIVRKDTSLEHTQKVDKLKEFYLSQYKKFSKLTLVGSVDAKSAPEIAANDENIIAQDEAQEELSKEKSKVIVELLGQEYAFDHKRVSTRLIQVYYHFTQKELENKLDKQNAKCLLQYILDKENENDDLKLQQAASEFTEELKSTKFWRKKFGIDGVNLPRRFYGNMRPSYVQALKRENLSSMLDAISAKA